MDYSQITKYLFIGSTPRTKDYKLLHDLGVKLVINMRLERIPHRDEHNPAMPVIWLPTVDSPLLPIPLFLLERGVKAALEIIDRDGKVYAHCAKGVHRGVAMGAAILIAKGYEPLEAMDLIKRRRSAADPEAGHIRRQILRFAQRWNYK